MFTKKFFQQGEDAKCFFRGYGSFGEIHGAVTRKGQTVSHKTEDYALICQYEMDEYGVCTRNDVFTNISKNPITLHSLKSRFIFEGGEYQVYTQFCNWQNESRGSWQLLTTTISVAGASARTTQDGAPFLALWSEQEQRGVAFHLVNNANWEMKVTRAGHYCKYSKIVVEMGIMDYNFDVTIAPGETVDMPQIICYEFKNKLDMDCYKLHNYLHTRYPRREIPIIYDTWMYCFDHISVENVSSQIQLAKDLGVEYFFIDAGWFGKGKDWSNSVGDWEENTTGAFCGHMIDVAEKVRAAGMKFGFWLEPERAAPDSDSVKAHPDYFIPGDVESEWYFLDFANEEAREWMLGIIFDLIERYGIEFIKDDFNADKYFDERHTALKEYYAGHKKFMQAIRDKYPNLYLSSCAGGGMRMELNNYAEFDSNWPSDNESPYDEMKIYKASILRLPPQGFERWVAVHSLQGFESFYESFASYNEGNTERMVASGDAIWHHVVGVQPSYLEGYMTCGPIGFSCDLNLISPGARARFKEFIAKVKVEREFWKTAVARILCDTESVMTLQYSDMALTKIVIQLFTDHTQQDGFTVHPVLDESKNYRINNGEILSGKEIAAEGISLGTEPWHDNWNEMLQVELEEV